MKRIGMDMQRAALTLALLLTLAATAYVSIIDPLPSDAAMQVTSPAEHPRQKTVAMPREADAPIRKKRNLAEVANDIFAVKTMPEPEQKISAVQPPTAPPPPPVILPLPKPPAPPPTAPPMPFTYLGKLGENNRYTVFLTARGRNYAVKAGDTVAQVYRIDEIKPPTMTLTYIPMNIQQNMPIGETN